MKEGKGVGNASVHGNRTIFIEVNPQKRCWQRCLNKEQKEKNGKTSGCVGQQIAGKASSKYESHAVEGCWGQRGQGGCTE